MFEKVNPAHPDKIADRIAGAIVDMAYAQDVNPRIAVEVLIGHKHCFIIAETSVELDNREIYAAVNRINGAQVWTDIIKVPQDSNLAENQRDGFRCGDNGIFKGMPLTEEQSQLSSVARSIYAAYPKDGKYILNAAKNNLIICQSCAEGDYLPCLYPTAIINPLGDWTGGTDVDTGATNRKLGSDMGDAVTGGGLHGKDLSKADVSVNIYAHLLAQKTNAQVSLYCAIGDTEVSGVPYTEIVEIAREYIQSLGGFEKFAEWGLI